MGWWWDRVACTVGVRHGFATCGLRDLFSSIPLDLDLLWGLMDRCGSVRYRKVIITSGIIL